MTKTGQQTPAQFTVAGFAVDTGDNTISNGDHCTHIEPKAMSVLCELVTQAGVTISRDELLSKVWGDRIVVEEALTRTISQLRIAFQDNKSKVIIQTVPKKGYRLTADVCWHPEKAGIQSDEQPSASQSSLSDHESPLLRKRILVFSLLLSIVVLSIVWFVWMPKTDSQLDSAQSASIAVMPLQNLTGDPDATYLSQGLPEEILSRLAQIPELHVSSRYSSYAYAEQNMTLRQIADTLNVKFILEGSVARTTDEYRVVVTLIDAHLDKTVWSQTYQLPESHLPGLQDKITRQVSEALLPGLAKTNEEEYASSSDSLEAYQSYLRGNYWLMNGKTSEWFARAESAFKKAIDADAGFAAAYGSLAYIYARHNYHDVYMNTEEATAQAKMAIDKALSFDPEDINALLATAILETSAGHFSKANRVLQKVAVIQPNSATVWYLFSELALSQGQLDKALDYALKAYQVDPMSPWVNVNLALVHYWRNELAQANEATSRAIDIDSQYTWAYVWRAKILLHQGRLEEAIETMEEVLKIDDASVSNAIFTGFLYLEASSFTSAQKWFEHAASLFGDSANARFWQSFIRFFYHREDLQIARQLLTRVTDIKNPFVSLGYWRTFANSVDTSSTEEHIGIPASSPHMEVFWAYPKSSDALQEQQAVQEAVVTYPSLLNTFGNLALSLEPELTSMLLPKLQHSMEQGWVNYAWLITHPDTMSQLNATAQGRAYVALIESKLQQYKERMSQN